MAAFASAGLDILVEHIVEKASRRADFDRPLLPLDVFWVGLLSTHQFDRWSLTG
ncbi:hypothetical protein D3273_16055 [Lichenibacterium minor]|uniref:Uncharacterized protein n=1 Tax=Lichenibacterium minor TaxID=2316528 RepID=A0A4Q2U864_9HYPH|nr:hypothetical protein D3273_16055 [Lichenibacterium minor]